MCVAHVGRRAVLGLQCVCVFLLRSRRDRGCPCTKKKLLQREDVPNARGQDNFWKVQNGVFHTETTFRDAGLCSGAKHLRSWALG